MLRNVSNLTCRSCAAALLAIIASSPVASAQDPNADGALREEVEFVLDLDGDGIPDILLTRRGAAFLLDDNVADGGFLARADGFRDAGLRHPPDLPDPMACEQTEQCFDVESSLGRPSVRSGVNTGKLTVIYLPDTDAFFGPAIVEPLAGGNGTADTTANPASDDVQVIPAGTSGLSPADVIIRPGPDGVLDTTPAGDDVVGSDPETDDSLLYVGLDIFNGFPYPGHPDQVVGDPAMPPGMEDVTWHLLDFEDLNAPNELPLLICDEGVADYERDPNEPNVCDPNGTRDQIPDFFGVPFDVDADGDPQRIGRWDCLLPLEPECEPPFSLEDTLEESYEVALVTCFDPPRDRPGAFLGSVQLVVRRASTDIELVLNFPSMPPVPADWVETFPVDGESVLNLDPNDPSDVEFIIRHVDTIIDRKFPATPYLIDRLRFADGGVQTFSDANGDSAAEDRINAAWFVEHPQIDVMKEVRCVQTGEPGAPNDPNWAEFVEALPGAELEFRITVENTGNVDLAVELEDVLEGVVTPGIITPVENSLEVCLYRNGLPPCPPPGDLRCGPGDQGCLVNIDTADDFDPPLDPGFFEDPLVPGVEGFLASLDGTRICLGVLKGVDVCADPNPILGDKVVITFRATVDPDADFCTEQLEIDIRNSITAIGDPDFATEPEIEPCPLPPGPGQVEGNEAVDRYDALDTPRERGGAILDGGNGIAETIAAGDDIQVVPPGQALRCGGLVVRVGPDGMLDSTAAGDDQVSHVIKDGGDVTAETTAMGDDIQVVPPGDPTVPDGIVVLPGCNGQIDSEPNAVGDDVIRQGYDDNVVTVNVLCRDVTFVKDVQFCDDCNNIPGSCDDFGDSVTIPQVDPGEYPLCVRYRYTVTNNGEVDEEVTVTDLYLCNEPNLPIIIEPLVGGDGIANTTANPASDDIQVVPFGQLVEPGELIILPGPDGTLQTIPGGDDVQSTGHPGLSLVDCDVCPPWVGVVPKNGGQVELFCTVQFDSPAALEAFLRFDDGLGRECDGVPVADDPECYTNCGQVTANATNLGSICDTADAIELEDPATICLCDCEIQVTKTVVCLQQDEQGNCEPNEIGSPAGSIDAVPGSCVRFEINVTNVSDPNEPVPVCKLRITDCLSAAVGDPNDCIVIDPNSVSFTIDGTPCPVPGDFNVDCNAFEFDPNTCNNHGYLQPGEVVTITFDGRILSDADPNDCDLTNDVLVEGEPFCNERCSGSFTCEDSSQALIDVKDVELSCTKEWSALWDLNADCDPTNDPNSLIDFTSSLNLSDKVFPVLLGLRVTARNEGEVPLSVIALDQALCDCVNTTDGVSFVGDCELCDPNQVARVLQPQGQPGDTATWECVIRVETAEAMRALDVCDGTEDGRFENTVTVTGTPTGVCPGDDVESDCSAEILAPPACEFSVFKEVKCADEPDTEYGPRAEALPGARLTFRIRVQNDSEFVKLPRVCIKDVLSCSEWFMEGSVHADIAGDDVTACVSPKFENHLRDPDPNKPPECYWFSAYDGQTPCRQAAPWIADWDGVPPGETLTITFDVIVPPDFDEGADPNCVPGPDPDCVNEVTVEGFTEVCVPPPLEDNPCATEGPVSAEINALVPEIECVKEVCIDFDNDGNCDTPFAGEPETIPCDEFPFTLIYRFTAHNSGETGLINVKICDPDLIGDALAAGPAGIQIVSSDLITDPLDPNFGCAPLDDLAECCDTDEAFCRILVPDHDAWLDLAGRDGDNDPHCYSNSAKAFAEVDTTDICAFEANTSVESEPCPAKVCVRPPCKITVDKKARCLTACPGEPAGELRDDLQAVPGSPVEFYIEITNARDPNDPNDPNVPICRLRIKDDLTVAVGNVADCIDIDPNSVTFTLDGTPCPVPPGFNLDSNWFEFDPNTCNSHGPMLPGETLTIRFCGVIQPDADPDCDPNNWVSVEGAPDCPPTGPTWCCDANDVTTIDVKRVELSCTKEWSALWDSDADCQPGREYEPVDPNVFTNSLNLSDKVFPVLLRLRITADNTGEVDLDVVPTDPVLASCVRQTPDPNDPSATSVEVIIEPHDAGDGLANTTADPLSDDVQLVPAGQVVVPGQVIILPGPNKVLDTTPAPDDVVEDCELGVSKEVKATESATWFCYILVDTAEAMRALADCDGFASDDVIIEPVVGNGVADTTAVPDDVQVIPQGNAANPGDVIIRPGPNKVLDTTPAGDDIAVKVFNNTVMVTGTVADPNEVCPGDEVTSECSAEILAPPACEFEVTKQAICIDCNDPNDPNAVIGSPTDPNDPNDVLEMAPDSCARFIITIKNTSNHVTIPRVCVTDTLGVACRGTYDANSVTATIDSHDVTACVKPTFEVDGTRVCFTFAACRPTDPWIAPGETLTITFNVINVQSDCANRVTVDGFTEVCAPAPDAPCATAQASVELDVLAAGISCVKTVAVDYGADNPNDPEVPAGPSVIIDPNDPQYQLPLGLVYTYRVENSGEVPLDGVTICDQNLCTAANALGLPLEPWCELDPVTCCADLGTIPPGGWASVRCGIVLSSETELSDFFEEDDDNDPNCFTNVATATGEPNFAGLCPPENPPGAVSSDCTARVCIRPFEPCPPIVKALFWIWNENEVALLGMERCLESWYQQLLSRYTEGLTNVPNNFLRTTLQTDKGRARIDGVRSVQVCGPDSIDAPFLGVVAKILEFPSGRIEMAGVPLIGIGREPGRIVAPVPFTPSDQKPVGRDPADGPSPGGPGRPTPNRAGTSHRGSLVVFPKVEIKWDAAGNVIQDTFLSLTNDGTRNVQVQLFLVNGNPRKCNYYSNVIRLTRNEPAYWSALTGDPKGVLPFTILDPPRGVPDDDPLNPGGTVLRGYVLAWAIDMLGAEIKWNHLMGAGTIVSYQEGAAWEYSAWMFRALPGDEGQPLFIPYGTLLLDGNEYEYPPALLLMDFFAPETPLVSRGGVSVTVRDTDLTLWAANKVFDP